MGVMRGSNGRAHAGEGAVSRGQRSHPGGGGHRWRRGGRHRRLGFDHNFRFRAGGRRGAPYPPVLWQWRCRPLIRRRTPPSPPTCRPRPAAPTGSPPPPWDVPLLRRAGGGLCSCGGGGDVGGGVGSDGGGVGRPVTTTTACLGAGPSSAPPRSVRFVFSPHPNGMAVASRAAGGRDGYVGGCGKAVQVVVRATAVGQHPPNPAACTRRRPGISAVAPVTGSPSACAGAEDPFVAMILPFASPLSPPRPPPRPCCVPPWRSRLSSP